MTEDTQDRAGAGAEWMRPGWLPGRILVPLDGSSESERILHFVVPLAEKAGASMVLMAVLDTEDPDDLEGIPAVADPRALALRESATEMAKDARDKAYRYLNRVASQFESTVSEIEVEVAFGEPADEIIRVSRAERDDMVAMSTRRESALARGILGSVTSRVLSDAHVPTLVVRVDERGQAAEPSWPENILVPLDVSPLSESAVDAAISVAKATGAKVRFFRVTPRAYYPGLGGAIEYAGAGIFFGAELRDEALEYLSLFVDRARSEGVDAFSEARSGSAAEHIVDALQELPGSMAVMTSHGRSGFQRWALGSVADKVVRSSARPVLILPAPRAPGE